MAPSRGDQPAKEWPQDGADLSRISTSTPQDQQNAPITPSQTRRLSPNRIGSPVLRVPSIQIARISKTGRPQPAIPDEERGEGLERTVSRKRRLRPVSDNSGSASSEIKHTGSVMPSGAEDGKGSTAPAHPVASASLVSSELSEVPVQEPGRLQRLRSTPGNLSRRLRGSAPPGSFNVGRGMRPSRQYDSNAVDLLDVIGRPGFSGKKRHKI